MHGGKLRGMYRLFPAAKRCLARRTIAWGLRAGRRSWQYMPGGSWDQRFASIRVYRHGRMVHACVVIDYLCCRRLEGTSNVPISKLVLFPELMKTVFRNVSGRDWHREETYLCWGLGLPHPCSLLKALLPHEYAARWLGFG